MPDLPKLVALADLFGTSLDALVRPEAVVETKPSGTVQVAYGVQKASSPSAILPRASSRWGDLAWAL